VCEHYSPLKHDFLYRGDVLRDVPFVSLDAGEIQVLAPEMPDTPPLLRPVFAFERDHPRRGQEAMTCVALLERLPGVVVYRTCEANKPMKKYKMFGSVMVAPIRPFAQFSVDEHTGRPFHELILEGFPNLEIPEEPPGDAWRFMVLMPCAEHGLPEGGIVCFREMQPVPIRHLLGCEKITRLAISTVGVLDYRIGMFFQQTEKDNEGDSAPEGPDSPIVAKYKRGKEKEAARTAATATAAQPATEPAKRNRV